MFGRRSAVFALRAGKTDIVEDALTAIAITVQGLQVEYREILGCLSLLYHAANRVGADADKMFRRAALLARPDVAKLIVGFADRTPEKRKSGYEEVETEKGTGLIGSMAHSGKHEPTIDLKMVAIEVAHLAAADKYQPRNITVGFILPSVWLSRGKNAELEKVLADVRGGANVSAKLRPGEHPKYESQQFNVFIVEASQATDAQALLRLSKSKSSLGHSMVGVAADRLFALIVVRSFVNGVEAFETPKSLTRFRDGLSKILNRYAKKTS